MSSITIKRGDFVPLSGQVNIIDDRVDVTASIDFSDWEVFCQIRSGPTFNDTLLLTVSMAFLGPTGGLFDGELLSMESASLPDVSYMDLRFTDNLGRTRSSRTVTILAEDPVTVGP